MSSQEVPTFFGPAESSLFGVLHLPHDRRVRGGVIICSPLGKEAMDAVLVERILARDLADRGFAVLRFDYLGTGDSAYPQDQPDAVENWCRSVQYAVDYLDQAGVTSITAVGWRAGALLANEHLSRTQAAGKAAFERVVFVDPVGTGRRYMREQQALFKVSVVEGTASQDDTVSIIGARFSAVAAKEFSTLRLPAEPVPGVDHFLVLRSGGVDSGVDALARAAEVESVIVEGLTEFSQPAEIMTPIPLAAVDAVAQWLDATCDSTAATTVEPTYRTSSRMPVAGGLDTEFVLERIESVGARGLFTIRASPEQADPGDGNVVMFCGTANDPHFGPAREWVELSRRIAQSGAQAVRWDRLGVGESGVVTRKQWRPVYIRSEIADAVAVARQAANDSSKLHSVGICSGSWYAAHAGRAGASGSVIIINALIWNWWTTANYLWQWNVKKTITAKASAPQTSSRRIEKIRKNTIEMLKPARATLKRGALKYTPWQVLLLLGYLGVAQAPGTVIAELARRRVRTTVLLCPQDADEFATKGGIVAIRRWARRSTTPPQLITSTGGDHAAYSETMLTAVRQTVLAALGDSSQPRGGGPESGSL